MTLRDYVSSRVHGAYHDQDTPCAATALRILGEIFEQDIHEQVLQAAWGLNGAGKHGDQCALVEGTLMLLGLLGHRRGLSQEELYLVCREYAQAYTGRFGSLLCRELRPGGFNDSDPPHLCEAMSVDAIVLATNFITAQFELEPRLSHGAV